MVGSLFVWDFVTYLKALQCFANLVTMELFVDFIRTDFPVELH